MGIYPSDDRLQQPKIRLAWYLAVVAFTLLDSAGVLFAQDLPSADAVTSGLSHRDGFIPVYWNDAAGKVLLEIEDDEHPFLYHTALAGGLGSNDVGLDRGLLGAAKIVRFKRIGSRVLLFEENLRFRAVSDNQAERTAVSDAFAPSVVHGFDIVGRTGSRLVLDATSFIVRDAMGIARQFKNTDQGEFALDEKRSAVNPEVLRSFPDNTELEAWLTFSAKEPGAFVRDAAADPYAVTLRIRHSLLRLPDDRYVARRFDPRSGYYGITFVDYATAISAEKEQRFIARHRLEVNNGTVVDPIVYYLDPGVPEPIRSALLDGARWWADAFAAAGLPGAFRVDLLPEDADPLDARYNMIQWVHRATRGWSWGDTIVDPRTGEIVKGFVALGSLRVRQDYLLAQGLLDGPAPGDVAADDPMEAAALARIRQLAAHEVGHTLGLVHNFAASISDRASVMDYPAPLVRVDASGRRAHDDAYAVGIGEWDKYAIRYGYTVFANPDEEADGLQEIIRQRRDSGLAFITDEDARPTGGAHPDAHLWDNEPDVLGALQNEVALRREALGAFGVHQLPEGRPLATLEEVFVPLYLRHRYQIEAAVKLVGGVWYEYEIVGQPSAPVRPVDAAVQRQAVEDLIRVLAPSELRVPESIRRTIPPRPPGYPAHRELFARQTGLTFDAYAPAASLADFVFDLLIHPERATRLTYQRVEDADQLGLEELLQSVRESVFNQPPDTTAYDRVLRRIVQESWVRTLVDLGVKAEAAEVASIIHGELSSMSEWLGESGGLDQRDTVHRRRLSARIDRFLLRTFENAEEPDLLELPPGSPIGSESDN